jgi:putative oxidoreductase
MIQVFDAIDFGPWFRFFTAVVEIAGAIARVTLGLTAFRALWLGASMFFATLTHLFVLHTSAAPALLLPLLSLAVAWLRLEQPESLKTMLPAPPFGDAP